MPPRMMRSAAPDFGDHGRTHRGHDTTSDQRPNERSGGRAAWLQPGGSLAGWPTGACEGAHPLLVRLGLDRRRRCPQAVKWLTVC